MMFIQSDTKIIGLGFTDILGRDWFESGGPVTSISNYSEEKLSERQQEQLRKCRVTFQAFHQPAGIAIDQVNDVAIGGPESERLKHYLSSLDDPHELRQLASLRYSKLDNQLSIKALLQHHYFLTVSKLAAQYLGRPEIVFSVSFRAQFGDSPGPSLTLEQFLSGAHYSACFTTGLEMSFRTL